MKRLADETTKGTWFIVLSYGLWGIFPFYWKLLITVPPEEILVHRIVWSFAVASLFVAADPTRRKEAISLLRTPRRLLILVASAVLITINWFVYIRAVNTGNIVEASLGYYINPLLSILIGFVFLREKADRWLTAALLLAAVGVTVAAVSYGRVPWIALALAFSFAFYGYLKKRLPISGVLSLAVETTILAPFAIAFLAVRSHAGTIAFGTQGPLVTVLLALSGIVTAVPLVAFAEGARRIPLSRVGFIQYMSPTISLVIGIFVYGEDFSLARAASFAAIWAAIGIYLATRKRATAGPS
jgi:chloramphenicol-sensitive protein RarD